MTFSPPDDPFDVPVESYLRDMTINTTSAYVAAQQAVAGFKELPPTAARSFFFTGNICNLVALPGFMDQAMGKAASANMIMHAAAAYKEKGFKYVMSFLKFQLSQCLSGVFSVLAVVVIVPIGQLSFCLPVSFALSLLSILIELSCGIGSTMSMSARRMDPPSTRSMATRMASCS